MTKPYFKSLILAASLGATALLAGCGSPPAETEVEQIELETEPVEVPAAEDAATPAVAEVPEVPTEAHTPVESVPLEPRSSEQSVQPDSETLFY